MTSYIETLRDYSAFNIAEDQLARAVNAGMESMWRQALDRGYITVADLEREWVVTPDDRLCAICAPMAGERASLLGSWTLKSGIQVPTPTDAHPRCRCTQKLVKKKGA
jgi:hypothetical protein